MIFVGDLHRNVELLKQVIAEHMDSDIVCLGDIGIGVDPVIDAELVKLFAENPNLYTCRGNHDNPAVIATLSGYLSDGMVMQTNQGPMMIIGGAASTDKAYRTVGYDLWNDEEISVSKFYEIVQSAANVHPTIIVSHDGPTSIIEMMFNLFDAPGHTRKYLQHLHNMCKPALHIFGHHHRNKSIVYADVEFRCVALDNIYEITGLEFTDR